MGVGGMDAVTVDDVDATSPCGLVVVDVAIVERDCATIDAEATSVLPEVENMACE